MRVVFIGGTGNISSDCAELLHERGHEVTVVTRGNTPAPDWCKQVTADRTDAAVMNGALGGAQADVVINFLGFDVPDLEVDYQLFGGKISQYIFISSATVYAKPHRDLPITEKSLLGNPFSDYAQKKQKCEEWLRARREETGFPVTVVRPSHTYSRRWIPNVVVSSGYTFAARLEQGKPVFVHDDGQGLWTMTSTRDFAVGLAGLVGQEAAIGETYHVTSDEVLTWNQIYAEIAMALGVDSPDVRRIPTDFICARAPEMTAKLTGDKAEPGVFDNARIKKAVPDFECRTSFRQGMHESVEWFNEDPARKTVDDKIDALFDTVISAWDQEQ